MNAKIVNFRIENVRRVNFFIPECVEHALVSYGTSISVDMKKAYALSWRFDIECNKNNKKIGDCIICYNNLFEIYSKYNDVNISIVDVIDSENVIRVVECNIEKNIPTIIHLDTYYSNWGPLYLKEHTNHVAMAIGMDQYNKCMYIVDPDYSEEKLCVDFSVIDKATKFKK